MVLYSFSLALKLQHIWTSGQTDGPMSTLICFQLIVVGSTIIVLSVGKCTEYEAWQVQLTVCVYLQVL
jgi:hypothetical protein